MLTCRELLQLESFHGVSLVAGATGLDNVISWPYPKHTKVISPWVRGGEFVMVSGYEYGVNDTELIRLLDEAETNRLSGILVEGGINFNSLSDAVIAHADQLGIPLFFTSRVVSFLDISREMSNAIMESNLFDKFTSSLLKKLVTDDTLSRKNAEQLFKDAGIPSDALFRVFLISIIPQSIQNDTGSTDYSAMFLSVLNSMQSRCNATLSTLKVKSVVYPSVSSVAYLGYGESASTLENIFAIMRDLREQYSRSVRGHNVILSVGCMVNDVMSISNSYLQAHYTSTLLRGGQLAGNVYSFDDLGSYQLPFYIEDKNILLAFRDRYLKELHKNEQLLSTLRAYITFGGNMLRTAEALYIHRNTLSYRIQRIELILGKKLSDVNTYRDLLNALMLLDIYPYEN